ncbi:MAG: glycosyltransferase family 4 protein [Nitrososphaerales archaeon]
MHIVVLSLIYPPDLGGSATRARNVARGLQLRGNGATVVAGFPHYPEGDVPKNLRKRAFVKENDDGIVVIRTWVPPLASKGLLNRLVIFACFMISSLFALVHVRRVDGVFASNPQILAVFPAKVYGWLFGAPVILNVDDMWPESLSDLGMLGDGLLKRVSTRIARSAYRIADAIAPISPAYVEPIVTKYGVPKSKVEVIPGGVDLALFQGESGPSQRSTFEVLYIGAFSGAYNFSQVLQAANELRGVGAIRFELRGQGETAPAIKREMERLQIQNVSLTQSVVSRAEAARLMMNADALLLPLSGTENVEKGISSKLYEYQAAGRPIVCCSRGTPGDYVRQSGSGLVVQPGDSAGLAAAVLRLYKDAVLASELGRSGREFVLSRYSVERVGEMANSLFESVR